MTTRYRADRPGTAPRRRSPLARRALIALLAGVLPCLALAARPSLEEQADVLAETGYEHPVTALASLRQLLRDHTAIPEQRVLLQAIGQVEAQRGQPAEASAIADQLLTLAARDPSGRAQAAATMVRAQIAETSGYPEVATGLAQSALPVFLNGCPLGAEAPPLPSPADTCDYRWAWRALRMLEVRANSQGVRVTASAHAQTALRLAESAGDIPRQVVNLGWLAVYAQAGGERRDNVDALLAQARRLDARSNEPATHAHLGLSESRVMQAQGNSLGSLRVLQDALVQARLADAPRLQARILTNLGDEYSNLGRPADALRAAERALPIARSYNDNGLEVVLLNNIGTAKIGVGRLAEGKRDMAHVQALIERRGETGFMVSTLREFGEALAAAGDARGALDLYHREQTLSAELMRVNREAALKELQARNDAQARQRDIELLGRDNALKTAALVNRDLLARLWWLLAGVMTLAIALVALLYRRVRETNRRLAASHVQLQAQSERDPLTNLANRRHFQAVMAKLSARGGFDGALLLVDLDHFKSVNDVHGHGAGDAVLVEVARRLNESVRSGDLVVRWGGEEFLILAPRAAPEQADQMATRVLHALGDMPMDAGTVSLRVTASIGYARFPLSPYTAAVPWEQAVNLTDMALYTAKNQGRNRAVGITSTTAATPQALRDAEADFDRAWHEGRITLLVTPGPRTGDTRRAA